MADRLRDQIEQALSKPLSTNLSSGPIRLTYFEVACVMRVLDPLLSAVETERARLRETPLTRELMDKTYRDGYVASQAHVGLPIQIRSLRLSRQLTQGALAVLAGMTQSRIAEIEKPGARQLNLETLLRLAAAFDVGLSVKFVPFSQLLQDERQFDPDHFHVSTFEEEVELLTPPPAEGPEKE